MVEKMNLYKLQLVHTYMEKESSKEPSSPKKPSRTININILGSASPHINTETKCDQYDGIWKENENTCYLPQRKFSNPQKIIYVFLFLFFCGLLILAIMDKISFLVVFLAFLFMTCFVDEFLKDL